jgi:hypothetical protein
MPLRKHSGFVLGLQILVKPVFDVGAKRSQE